LKSKEKPIVSMKEVASSMEEESAPKVQTKVQPTSP